MSIYFYDVILLLKASIVDFYSIRCLVDLLGSSSGLRGNWPKRSIFPIIRNENLLKHIGETLNCEVEPPPIKYLGLPLQLKKWRKEDFQSLLDKLGGRLPFWKTGLLVHSGCLILIHPHFPPPIVHY